MSDLDVTPRAALLLALALAAHGCTPADRRAAADVVSAAGPALCALVPLFDGPDLAAVLCEDAARIAAGILAATVHVQEKGGAPVACVMVPLQRVGGDPRERVCESKRDRVLRAIGGAR